MQSFMGSVNKFTSDAAKSIDGAYKKTSDYAKSSMPENFGKDLYA